MAMPGQLGSRIGILEMPLLGGTTMTGKNVDRRACGRAAIGNVQALAREILQ
jgi:hypothetical protein